MQKQMTAWIYKNYEVIFDAIKHNNFENVLDSVKFLAIHGANHSYVNKHDELAIYYLTNEPQIEFEQFVSSLETAK